jgi:teichuronic acid biosynthesis glycosyltransferase TuaC
VTVVTPAYPTSDEPFRGIYNYHRANALQEWADVRLICAMPAYPAFLRPRAQGAGRRSLKTMPGLAAVYVEYPALPFVSRAVNSWVCARSIAPLVREAGPDLLLAYWVYPEGLAAVHVARRLGVPVVVGAIGSDLRAIADPFSRFGVRTTLRRADRIVTVSRELGDKAVSLGAMPARVRPILNGCDGNVFRPAECASARRGLGLDPGSRIVLFVGRLVEAKGVLELLEAVAIAGAHIPTLEVAFIGLGPLEAQLRARTAGEDLRGRARFLGTREPPEVARWLAASDLLCLPSHSEGCPNVVIEALRCGRPVVAAKVGGVPELVDEDSAVLVPPGDAPSLARGLVAALGRRWDEQEIARRHGRTWADVGRETWEVCRSLLREGEHASSPARERTEP